MKSKARLLGLICLGWLALGVLVNGLILPERLRGNDALSAPSGERPGFYFLAWEFLGGLRTLAADAAWLGLHEAWQEREPRTVMTWLRLVTELEPAALYFRVNGARLIAYDMPAWHAQAGQALPLAAQEKIRREQADLALAFLDAGRPWHASNPLFWVERAGIELNGRREFTSACADFRRAAELPGAPYFAARLHAELLCQLGRTAEAYTWLCRIHPDLPADDFRAQTELVLARIRALEDRLQIPVQARYRWPR